MPRRDLRRLRRDLLRGFAVRFLLSLLPLTALWYAVAPAYTATIFAGANLLFGWDRPPVARVGESDGTLYAYRLTPQGPQPVFAFEKYGLFFNVIVLVAVVLAAPGLRWTERALRAGIAIVGLVPIHVLFVVVEVKAQFVNLGLISASPAGAYGLNWLAVLLGPVGEALFPLLIAALLTGRAWKEALGLRFSTQVIPTSFGRNAPCPCGSGKKYKHCCGGTGR